MKKVNDSFYAFLVEGANFTSVEEYPILEKENVSKLVPEEIIPFSKALHYKGDLSHTFVSFYERDENFERVRRYPKRYLSFLQKTAGIISLDFSVHTDMNIIKQKSQMNDNLSITYFYSTNGIKYIPNIRYGVDEIANEYFEAIPKHTLIAIGTHGFIKENWQKAEWYCYIENIIDKLNPTGIIVLGPLPKEIIDDFSLKCKFYVFDSWMDQNRRNSK